MTGRLTYNVSELAEALGVSRPFLYQYLNSGELPSVMLGRRRLIRREDVEAFLAAHMDGES